MTANPPLVPSVRRAGDLAPDEVQEMFALFSRHYDGADAGRFRDDLAAKREAVLVHDRAGRLVGFTTLAVLDAPGPEGPVRVIYSGDTIMDRRHWGTQALNFAWIRHIARIKAERPDKPLYWLLISKGLRTYRYLAAFGRDFTPDWRGRRHPDLDRLKDRLARRLFGSAYDPVRGVVTHDPPRDRLASDLAEIPHRDRADARFFLDRNPGYREGEELVCLCALEAVNMKPLAQRLLASAS